MGPTVEVMSHGMLRRTSRRGSVIDGSEIGRSGSDAYAAGRGSYEDAVHLEVGVDEAVVVTCLRGGGDGRLTDRGLAGTGLQVMKFGSQTPAQTSPPAVTVTRLVLLLA